MTNKLRDVRKSKHVTLEELAEKTGTSSSFLSRIESGTRKLTLEIAVRAATTLGCDVVDITDEFSDEDIDAAGRLGPKKETKGDIPNLTIHAGLGNGGTLSAEINQHTGFIADEFTDGFWTFPDGVRAGFSHLTRTLALSVKGDSMEPTITGGSIAFVDTTHVMPSPPDIYAVDFGDGLVVKRIELIPRTEKVRIISDNQRYQTYEMKRDELTVFGRVIATFQWRG